MECSNSRYNKHEAIEILKNSVGFENFIRVP